MPADDSGRGPSLLIVVGEASGDLHGASLARALREIEPDVEIFGVGGDRMAAAGVELLYHMRNLAVVGITEVIRHLRDVRRALTALTRAATARRVDAIVLVDYPDFNLTLARRLRRRLPEVPIVYYISPQVWAWRAGRVRSIARLVDSMLVILPFEEPLYAGAGVAVEFVGHPLLDVARFDDDRRAFSERHGADPGRRWIGLLPGSRRAEVERLLPPMLEAVALIARSSAAPPSAGSDTVAQFLVPVSTGVHIDLYRRLVAAAPAPAAAQVRLIVDDYYPTLQHCEVAAVCSGTATLEAALADTPMVVVYRTSWLTYNLAKLLVHVRDIALVNLIAGRRVVPELIQGAVTGLKIAAQLRLLLDDDGRRSQIRSDLREVRTRLGEPGASRRAARAVVNLARAG